MHYPDVNDDVSYLDIKPEDCVPIPAQEEVWAKIGDDGQLEIIRWDLIELYAAMYDASNENRSQTQVFCKLLKLVRDDTRRECNGKAKS